MSFKLILVFVVQLFLITNTFAANVFVNLDCANNGNGTVATCAASDAGVGAYHSFEDLKTAYSGQTLTEPLNVDCRGDAVSPAINFTGITTTATNRINIIANSTARHAGLWDDSKITIATNGYDPVVRVAGVDITLDGFQIYSNCTTGSACNGVSITGSGSSGKDVKILNSIIKYYHATPIATHGIYLASDPTSVTLTLANNIIYGYGGNGMNLLGATSDKLIIYDNTVTGVGGNAIRLTAYGATDSLYLRNNIFSATGDDFSLEDGFVTYVHDKNITFDATSPDTAYRSKTIGFVDAANDNYHLAATDTDAIDKGDDLSATFTTDIDGQTRTGTWDIGADEYQSSVNYKLLLLRNELEY